MKSKKLNYKLDKFMAKGTKPLITLLVGLTLSIILFFALLIFVFSKITKLTDGDLLIVWPIITHLLDPGTVGNDDPQNVLYLIIMFLVTIVGLFINSILIGTISNAIDEKLSDLKKGNSKIIEKNHTVIIGFNEAAFTIINELIEANENQKRGCAVIVSNNDMEEMTEQLSYNISDTKNTEIIFRSGDTFENNVLDVCSIASAKSVIINHDNDFDTIKQIMVLTKYIEANNIDNSKTHVTALINKKENLMPAKLAGKNKVQVLFFSESISRIIAHSCRYPGLSNIFVDFFDFDGDEIYYEAFPELNGFKFNDVIMKFKKSAVIGLVKNGKPLLNPPMDTVYDYNAGDKVIHVAEDDNVSFPEKTIPEVILGDIENSDNEIKSSNKKNLLVLGYNEMLHSILSEFNNYVEKGSKVTIASQFISEKKIEFDDCPNLSVEMVSTDISKYENIETLFENEIDTVLILCDLGIPTDEADASVMMYLLYVRNIIESRNLKINVISEMRSIANQKIATDKNISDFVVGSNITSLIISQLSENPDLLPIFEDLLDEDGSELYMKPALNYVKAGVSVDTYQLQRIAEKRNEIVLGYKIFNDKSYDLITNPLKSNKVSFSENDFLIVIAED